MPNRPMAIDRRIFVTRAGGLFGVALVSRFDLMHALAQPSGLEHPEPRPGVTGERVLAATALGAAPKQKVLDIYEAARTYPAIFDGIACGCSCGGKKGTHRSLLVCFETPQATGCGSCQEEGELVGRLAREDKPLAEIRKAVDKEFS
jgi:hypothetical protein